MNEILEYLKGKKTIIVNALMFIIMAIDYFVGYGWVNANAQITVTLVAAVNAVLRFFTDTPIFDNGKKKV